MAHRYLKFIRIVKILLLIGMIGCWSSAFAWVFSNATNSVDLNMGSSSNTAGGLSAPSKDIGLPFQNQDSATSIAIIIREAVKYIGILAVITLTWGGVQFLISGGEEAQIKTAKNTIIWSLVGVLLAVSAYTIIDIVKDIRL